MPSWQNRVRNAAGKGRDWSQRRLNQAQQKITAGVDRLSENPDLPDGIREQLRDTRTELLHLIRGVRSTDDLRQLRPRIADLIADRIDAIADWTAEHPGDFHTIDDVERFCDNTIMWTAGTVDSVGFVAGAFAVVGAPATLGISMGHFFALCYAMGLLASLSDGTAELYAVTSWLAHQRHPDAAAEAVRLCAAPRHQRRSTTHTPVVGADSVDAAASDDATEVVDENDTDPDIDPSTERRPARELAWRWAKLSLAAGLPVFNDRYMGRENTALIRALADLRGSRAEAESDDPGAQMA